MTELEQVLEDLKRRLPSAGPGDRMLIEDGIKKTEAAIAKVGLKAAVTIAREAADTLAKKPRRRK